MDDLNATEQFYHGILCLPVIAKEAGRHVFFQVGTSNVLLAFLADATLIGDHLPSHGARDQDILPSALMQPLWTPGGSTCKVAASPSKRRCSGRMGASLCTSVIPQGIRWNL